MKKVLVVMLSVLLLGFVSIAQAVDDRMDTQKSGQMDKSMPMDCPMMKGMSGDTTMGGKMMNGKMMHPMMKQHGMMMHDMMQMMKDMMAMQKKMLASPKSSDTMKMQSDLDTMMSKMDKIMANQNCMMQMPMPYDDMNKGKIPSGDQQAPAEHNHR